MAYGVNNNTNNFAYPQTIRFRGAPAVDAQQLINKPIEKVENVVNKTVDTFVKEPEDEKKKKSHKTAITAGSSVFVLTALIALLNPRFSGKFVDKLKTMASKAGAKAQTNKNSFVTSKIYRTGEKVLQNVADFFRYNIKKDNDIVTIEDEIHLVDNYIYILNVRFSGEIHFEKEIDESLLATKIPGMILQPIVENSVNYGIRNIDWEGHIKLSVSKKDENICIAISDNGVGISTDRIDAIMHNQGVMDNVESERTDSNGVGLTNVMERLRLFFGGWDCFEITSDGKNQGTLVTITIPGQ